MVKLIIFDMDGVLVDSEKAITLASIEALNQWNVQAQYDDFKEYTGMGDDKFIGGVSEKYGVKYDLSMKAKAYEIYLEKAKERVKVFHWSKNVITELLHKGYKLAIASASDLTKVNRNIECIGIDKSVFSAIITGSDVINKKPAPDIFLKAAEKADIAPEHALVVEDALSGAKAAKAAGMQCITVTTSFDTQALTLAGADNVLEDLNDILNLL